MDGQTDALADELVDEQLAAQLAAQRAAWDCMANWTQAERDVWEMGPFDGGIPGMVRRIRRILDVSQRGWPRCWASRSRSSPGGRPVGPARG